MSKVVAIIQARMGSTRLPAKVMMKLCGKTVLEHVINRVKKANEIDEIVIATTTLEIDNVIVDEAVRCGAKYYRGSEDDVLSRYYEAAKENNADIVVRITSDCPLIDPAVVDNIVKYYKNSDYDIVTNAGIDLTQRTYPRGLDTEVFSFDMLKKVHTKATDKRQREHVTPYIYENSSNIYYYKNAVDYSKFRWTLDTPEDFELISSVYDELYCINNVFLFEDILAFFQRKPGLSKINEHIEQKSYK